MGPGAYHFGATYVGNKQMGPNEVSKSAIVAPFLLSPNSDHVMTHLEGCNYVICHRQLIAAEYVQIEK